MRRRPFHDLDSGAAELKPVASVGAFVPTPLTVESFDNHIYFYSEVDSDRCLALLRQLRDLDASLRSQRVTRGLDRVDMLMTPIWLHVNSDGGSLFDAFAVADQIERIESPIYTVVEGMAASAATILSLAGDKRYALPSAMMCVHQFSTWFWGTYEKFKDSAKLNEATIKLMRAFYQRHTKASAEWIEEALKHDYYMTADEMLERGFVDEILQPVDCA